MAAANRFFARTLLAAFLFNLSDTFKFPSDNTSKIDSPCTTPLKRPGLCIALSDCPSLLKKLHEKVPGRTSAGDILRLSHCGFVGKEPYVCCPSDRTDETTPRPAVSVSDDGVVLSPNLGMDGDDPEKHPNLRLLRRDICGNDFSDKIFGGSEARLKQFPWMALIQRQYDDDDDDDGPKVLCGGSLINERYIMTAAHCFTRDPQGKQITVRLGEHNILTDPDCEGDEDGQICGNPVQSFNIEEVVIHSKYNNRNKTGDIALIRLNRTAPMTEYISPICLPSGEFLRMQYVGEKLFVAGWGLTENGTYSNVKRWVKVPVVSNAECGKTFNRSFDDTLMCAGAIKGEDSCRSDSGGPLMKAESVVPLRPGAQWVALGIVEGGALVCGSGGIPGLYTRVGPHVNWILDNLKP